MAQFTAFASDAAVTLDEPMNVFIIACTAVASIAGVALLGAFALSLFNRRG